MCTWRMIPPGGHQQDGHYILPAASGAPPDICGPSWTPVLMFPRPVPFRMLLVSGMGGCLPSLGRFGGGRLRSPMVMDWPHTPLRGGVEGPPITHLNFETLLFRPQLPVPPIFVVLITAVCSVSAADVSFGLCSAALNLPLVPYVPRNHIACSVAPQRREVNKHITSEQVHEFSIVFTCLHGH